MVEGSERGTQRTDEALSASVPRPAFTAGSPLSTIDAYVTWWEATPPRPGWLRHFCAVLATEQIHDAVRTWV